MFRMMKRSVVLVGLLLLMSSCSSRPSLDLDGHNVMQMAYVISSDIFVAEGDDLNNIISLLEDHEEISETDHSGHSILTAISLYTIDAENGSSIMIYPDSSGEIHDENDNTIYVRFNDGTYESLGKYLGYEIYEMYDLN